MAATWSMHMPRPCVNSGFGGKVLKYRDNLGCENERVHSAPIPELANWGIVIDMAMDMIDKADDQHHIFIEELRVCTEDPNVVWIETGS